MRSFIHIKPNLLAGCLYLLVGCAASAQQGQLPDYIADTVQECASRTDNIEYITIHMIDFGWHPIERQEAHKVERFWAASRILSYLDSSPLKFFKDDIPEIVKIIKRDSTSGVSELIHERRVSSIEPTYELLVRTAPNEAYLEVEVIKGIATRCTLFTDAPAPNIADIDIAGKAFKPRTIHVGNPDHIRVTNYLFKLPPQEMQLVNIYLSEILPAGSALFRQFELTEGFKLYIDSNYSGAIDLESGH